MLNEVCSAHTENIKVPTVDVLFSLVFDAYKKIAGSDIEDSIEGETTGNLENLLLAVGKTCDLPGSYCNDHEQATNNGVPSGFFFFLTCVLAEDTT